MTQLITFGSQKTMSSREIADLTGKEVSHVNRDIRAMLSELKKDDPKMDHPQEDKDERGYTICFHLNRELTDCLLTGYSSSARMRVIKRWHELEAETKAEESKLAFTLPDFTNPAAAARAWADAIEQKQEAEVKAIQAAEQLALADPTAEALDRIALSDGSMCLTNAAKVLGLPPKKFIAWMQEHQWIYRRAGSTKYIGYQHRVQPGYLDHKVTTVNRGDGSEKTVEQVLVTPKGLAKLAQSINPGGAAAGGEV